MKESTFDEEGVSKLLTVRLLIDIWHKLLTCKLKIEPLANQIIFLCPGATDY